MDIQQAIPILQNLVAEEFTCRTEDARCSFCDILNYIAEPGVHTEDCPIGKAKILLARLKDQGLL